MQFQADVLGVPVSVPEISETTALGAAYLAGVGSGYWSIDEVDGMWAEAARYEPAMDPAERDRLLARWRDAVTRSSGWARAGAAGQAA
jgi:glycerol kinase